MPNPFALQGASLDQSHFAPLMQSRIFTGIWTNRSALRDAATTFVEERYYGGRQDSIIDGLNCEVSSRLTLIRRPGTSIYNNQTFPQINRFYSFNTFSINDEVIRVMADTANTVYDATSNTATPNTKTAIWQKSAAAQGKPTFFLGVGDVLYMTNGVDSVQWNYTTGQVSKWGITAPINAPTAAQAPRPSPPPNWLPQTVYESTRPYRSAILILDTNGNMQGFDGTGTTGASQPAWNTAIGGITQDGSVQWFNHGPGLWQAQYGYGTGNFVYGMSLPSDKVFSFESMASGDGRSGTSQPVWPAGLGLQVQDAGIIWTNIGRTLSWVNDIGPGVTITSTNTILDTNGYLQQVVLAGKSGATAPTWQSELGAQTTDGGVIWANMGPWAVGTTGVLQWGYAFKNSATDDISNMSPPSLQTTVLQNNQVTLQGDGSTDPQVDTIIIYRTAQNGATFFYLNEIPAPPAGTKWTYVDSAPDTALNAEIQAAVNGENTPVPAGATCMTYHLQRIFVAVDNVLYFSTGPDAIVQGGNGNSGFQPVNSFTCQSKITRLWANSVGLVVFTVRDAYIVLLDQGTGAASAASSLFMTVLIEGLPLLHYDAFTVNKTTAILMTGQAMVISLEASAGILEISLPIADQIAAYDPKAAFVTWHAESSAETALYVSNGQGEWWRWAATTAPESGFNWSPRAFITNQASAVQSIEVTPGQNRLLIGPGPAGGPIGFRDRSTSADNGTPYAAYTTFGSIVLAAPGQLGGLAFITLESSRVGTATALSVLIGEIHGTFENVRRSRQDPPNLPPSASLYSDRFSLLQGQQAVWCRHFQMRVDWPAENAANELLGFTVFGQTWQEYRSQ